MGVTGGEDDDSLGHDGKCSTIRSEWELYTSEKASRRWTAYFQWVSFMIC